jgi:hypothetical protein
MNDGFLITNSHSPETVTVSGFKKWDDGNNQDGKRPESITINLLKNGEKVDSKTVTEKDQWSWTFDKLDKYEDGKEINYSITEEAVAGYSTTYDGYNVTNSYTPEKASKITNSKNKKNSDSTKSTKKTGTSKKSGKTKSTGGSANTGDNTNVFLWMALMLVSCCGLVGIFVFKKRRTTK